MPEIDILNDGQFNEALISAHNDVQINRYKLETECEKHSSLYLYYSELLAEAKSLEGGAVDNLDRILGKVELNLREDPPEGLKVTDSTIKALVAVNGEVDEAKERLRKIKKIRFKLDAIVSAFEHKKGKLDNLVVLWSKGYYMTDVGQPINSRDDIADGVRKNLNRGE